MIKHINEADSHEWVLVDLSTGVLIEHVSWADDVTGVYRVFAKDKEGGPILKQRKSGPPILKTLEKNGKILLVKSEEFHRRKSEFSTSVSEQCN